MEEERKNNEREKSTSGLGWRRVEEEVAKARQPDGAWPVWVGHRSAMGHGLKRELR